MEPTTYTRPVFKDRYACPVCGREFPRWHWAIPGKAGGYGTTKHYGLARFNFVRHLQACRRQHPQPEVEDVV